MANRTKPPNDRAAKPPKPRWASEAEVRAWMHARQMDRVAEYAARGKVHERLSIEELKTEWIDIFRRNTRSPTPELAQQENDLDAEFFLRQMFAPLQAVEAEIRLRIEAAGANLQHLKQNDPDAFLQANEDMQRDIDSLLSKGGNPDQ